MNNRMMKQRYTKIRKEFKNELFQLCLENKALTVLIYTLYSAYKHRRHIYAIWQLIGFEYRDAWKAYSNKLAGKMLTGSDEFFKTIYHVDKDFYNKYYRRLPDRIALGDAYSVAIQANKKTKDGTQ